jgi:hypothetical protein
LPFLICCSIKLNGLTIMQTTGKLAGTSRIGPARRLGLGGLGLFFLGFSLNGVGNLPSSPSQPSLLWVVPYADTLSALGFVLSLFGAARAGSSTREIAIIGIVFGVGTFYVGEPHPTHTASGVGFGLDHMPHIFIGLGLFAAATTATTFLSFYHTRKPLAVPTS